MLFIEYEKFFDLYEQGCVGLELFYAKVKTQKSTKHIIEKTNCLS